MRDKTAKKAANKRLKEARNALAALGPHHTEVESDEFLRRNRAVYAAEKNVWRGKRRFM